VFAIGGVTLGMKAAAATDETDSPLYSTGMKAAAAATEESDSPSFKGD